jgi:hypothetical protein
VALGHVVVQVAEQRLLPMRRALAFVGVMVPVVIALRAWILYKESFVRRPDELALGRDVAAHVPASEKVLLEPIDYGYFAVMAATGRPWQIQVRDQPRPGGYVDPLGPQDLVERARAGRMRFVIGRIPEDAPLEAKVVSLRGPYALFELEGELGPEPSRAAGRIP